MSETISKHIGEGFGKGELYAALAYDASDAFGGMKIKSQMHDTTYREYFRDSGLNIYSSADGILDIVSDSKIEVLVGTTSGTDYFRVKGASKFHNRPLTTNTFAMEVKADVKNSTGTFTGAIQNTVRSYPTTDTTAVTVTGAYFSTELHSGDTMTAGYLVGLFAQVANQGTCNGAGIIVTPQWNLMTDNGVFTSISHMCGLWLDSHVTKTITSGSFELLYMTNNASTTMDQAIYLHGNDKITNFITFGSCSGMVSATATTSGSSIKIKIVNGGTTYYINAYTG